MSTLMPRSSQLQTISASLLAAKQENQALLATPMLRIPEFAASMGISKSTAIKWVKSNLVKAYRTGNRGWLRIPLTEVQRLKGMG